MGFFLCDPVPLGIVEGGQGHRRLGAEVIMLIVGFRTGVRVLGDPGLDEQHRSFFGNGDRDRMVVVDPCWIGSGQLLVVH